MNRYYEVLFVAICLANMYVQGNYTGPQLEETMNIHDYYPFKFMNLDSVSVLSSWSSLGKCKRISQE